MSADFVLSHHHPDPSLPEYWWNASRGMVRWVVEILIEHTERDAELHARLRELHDRGAYYLITLDLFHERHAPEVVRILREHLPAAAKRDFPEFPDVVEHVGTLVQMANWWTEAVAGGNPPRTDSYT